MKAFKLTSNSCGCFVNATERRYLSRYKYYNDTENHQTEIKDRSDYYSFEQVDPYIDQIR